MSSYSNTISFIPQSLASSQPVDLSILSPKCSQTALFLPGISSEKHSVGLLSLALCSSLVDCTSSVTFVAYLTGMPEAYMGALTFGEAFSDIVPSAIALVQGVGGDPECVNITGLYNFSQATCNFSSFLLIFHSRSQFLSLQLVDYKLCSWDWLSHQDKCSTPSHFWSATRHRGPSMRVLKSQF